MILLRHGQSEFNLHFTATGRDPGIVDPALTPLGQAQAEVAAAALAGRGIRRIIASPYTRALQTARPIAAALGVAVEVERLVAERCAFACDIGSRREALERDWPDLDLSRLEAVWWPAAEEPEASVLDRAARFRAALAARADWAETLVVSHWGFIMAMTGRSVANAQWLRCDPTAPAPAEIAWPGQA